MRYRFSGEICGVGTASGTRIVIGRWPTSPFGAVADVMVEDGDGKRRLLAADARLARFVADTYLFDEDGVVLTDLTVTRHPDRLVITSEPLTAEIAIGGRRPLGLALRAIPRSVSAAPWWAAMVDPIARATVRGVRTRGSAKGGRREWYGAHDLWRVTGIRATWHGEDLGALANVDPPVTFGFASTPRRPSVTAITTTVEVP